MKLIVGLGNPGPKYLLTRHNVGFMVVDALAARGRVDVSVKAHRALVGRGRLAGVDVLLAKPQTFMNLSGESVSALMKAEVAGPDSLVVIHDDLDLPLGTLKISKSGGDGGHNGVASIISQTGTGSFVRMRVGIGRPRAGMEGADYVLSPFDPDEMDYAAEVINYVADALMVTVRNGPDRAMNLYNKRPAPLPGDGDKPEGDS